MSVKTKIFFVKKEKKKGGFHSSHLKSIICEPRHSHSWSSHSVTVRVWKICSASASTRFMSCFVNYIVLHMSSMMQDSFCCSWLPISIYLGKRWWGGGGPVKFAFKQDANLFSWVKVLCVTPPLSPDLHLSCHMLAEKYIVLHYK